MKLEERKDRIIARGELTDHSHIIVGPAKIKRTQKTTTITVNPEDGETYIKHLLESKWLEGAEVQTGDHGDIKLDLSGTVRHGDVLLKYDGAGSYTYIHQREHDPIEGIIREVYD